MKVTWRAGHLSRPVQSSLGILLGLASAQFSVASAQDAGFALLSDGRFDAARTAFNECLIRQNKSEDERVGAECLLGRASAAIMIGSLADAESDLVTLDRIAANEGFDDLRLTGYIARGRLDIYQAQYNQADDALAKAVALARQLGDATSESTAWLTRAEGSLQNLNRPRFMAQVRHAVAASEHLEPGAVRTRLLLSCAGTLLQAQWSDGQINSETNLASRLVADALEFAVDIADQRLMSLASGLLGELYLLADRPVDALKLARSAAFYAQQLEAPDLGYRWEWLIGRSLRANQSLEEAADAMERSIQQLAQVRSGLLAGIRGRRQSLRELVGPLFQDHADILLTLATRSSDEQLSQQLRSRARAIVEAFKSAELQDYFLDECVVEVQQDDTLLDDIAGDTAVLYPILLKDRTELLISVNGRISQFTVDATEQAVNLQAMQFRRALEGRSSHRYRKNARRLYEWLVRPAEAILAEAEITTIVFVPDGALRTIPLGALHDGTDFLIKRFSLATTPTLNLTDPRPIPRTDTRILVNGLTDAVQGYPALPSVEVELAAFQEMFTPESITMLKNQDFQADRISAAISERPFSVVHFASHGEFQSDVSQSFLLTYDEKLSMNQLDEFMQLRRFSEQPIELLTLSACQTAAGDDRAALGLAGIAIKAGARSAVGTLWFINDKAASQLISEFYGHLRNPENSKAEALRLAQLSLIDDRRYNHPGYWSPFLLIGNWL